MATVAGLKIDIIMKTRLRARLQRVYLLGQLALLSRSFVRMNRADIGEPIEQLSRRAECLVGLIRIFVMNRIVDTSHGRLDLALAATIDLGAGLALSKSFLR